MEREAGGGRRGGEARSGKRESAPDMSVWSGFIARNIEFPTVAAARVATPILPECSGIPSSSSTSWLGALFKGNKHLGPDFLEAGDKILDELELGSRFTWDLAHLDLLGNETFYGPTRRTPFVFIFCGNQSYGGLRQLFDDPGSDGTVRWASCPLNTRKINLDLTIDPEREGSEKRISIADWKNTDIPLIPIDGKNTGRFYQTRETTSLIWSTVHSRYRARRPSLSGSKTRRRNPSAPAPKSTNGSNSSYA